MNETTKTRRNNVEFHKGQAAHAAGESLASNPYPRRDVADSRWTRWNLGWQDKADGIQTDPETGRQFIDLTPTWAAVSGIYIACLENGTKTGRQAARTEIRNMARLADERNALAARCALLEAVAIAANESHGALPPGMARDELRGALAAAGWQV